jgi:predicted ATPase
VGGGFIRSVALKKAARRRSQDFPLSIPAVRKLGTLKLDPRATFLIGENGSGKSTLLEGIADVAGFAKEGGSKHFATPSAPHWSDLGPHLDLVRNAGRERDAFFLRSESFYNTSTRIEEFGDLKPYGDISPHERSHGEAFLMLMTIRFVGRGLYLLDEPEAALSPTRQLAFLRAMYDLIEGKSSQFIIATHSPVLMSYPRATIYLLDGNGIKQVKYESTDHFQLMRDFLNDRDRYFEYLFSDE